MPVLNFTEIQAFYNDCGVFITGGTGALGKLTIEKVLRSCPGVTKVFVLIRKKRGISVEDRKKELLKNVVFDRMRTEQPGSVEKIVVVPGDCSSPRLGLSDSDYHDLTQHVNIVLHLAATVRFDENLKTAININVRGTQEVIKLCHDCDSLKAAVFVSTAYSNSLHYTIKEEFYEPPFAPEDFFALMEKLSPSELEIMCPKILGAWPNTYIFSKAMSENVIYTQSKNLPASIVRPSMVTPTLREPIEGWLDNLYGPMAVVVGTGGGVLRVSFSDPDKVFDVVPADIVTNCVIAAALSSGKSSNEGVINIYNFAVSSNNSVTLREFQEPLLELLEEKPAKMCIWFPFLIHAKSHFVYMVLAFFLHFLPGFLLDFALKRMSKPTMFLRIYRKIQKFGILTSFFSMRNFMILTDNTQALYNSLDIRDKEIFFFNSKVIDWPKYLKHSCNESRKYLLNGILTSVDVERKHRRRLYIIHTVVKTIIYGLILWTAWCVLKPYVKFL